MVFNSIVLGHIADTSFCLDAIQFWRYLKDDLERQIVQNFKTEKSKRQKRTSDYIVEAAKKPGFLRSDDN